MFLNELKHIWCFRTYDICRALKVTHTISFRFPAQSESYNKKQEIVVLCEIKGIVLDFMEYTCLLSWQELDDIRSVTLSCLSGKHEATAG